MQLISIQNELQKQMTVMVAVPVAKEGKRMESKSPSILLFRCYECSERITILEVQILFDPNLTSGNVIRWSLKDVELSMATLKNLWCLSIIFFPGSSIKSLFQ